MVKDRPLSGPADNRSADEPDFACETRVIEYDRSLPSSEAMDIKKASSPIPAVIAPRILIIKGEASPALLQMEKPFIIFGRVEGVADIVVHDDAASRYHAYLSHQEGSFYLYDMGSTNGTFVNGQPASKVELASGDEIRIGQTILRFDILAR